MQNSNCKLMAPLISYLIINLLFIVKYSARISYKLSVVLAVTYTVSVFMAFFILQRVNIKKKSTLLVLILSYAMLLAIGQSLIDPYLLKVDRWSAIHNFIYNLFHGIYPYSAQTHLGGYGSPFPAWQFFHIPFYLLGNVGLSFFFSLGIFFASIWKTFTSKQLSSIFVLMLLSPAIMYECLVRSDLITNFIIVASTINYLCLNNVDVRKHWKKTAFIVGIFLSTRLATAIPFFIYLFPYYRNFSRRQQIMFPLYIICTFMITFVPFMFWNGEMLFFFQYNPFILQTRQGSMTIVLLLIPIITYLALSWKNDFRQLMFHISLAMIVLVVVTFTYNMYTTNTWCELFQSRYDITYLDMSLPFLLTWLSTYSFPCSPK